ncbi:MAG: HAMP domain-containing histidine kinase [Rhizobiales bacterium]|nr:HAMP domain-containing histidine kinase [Hyphomicrobiales bacterium]
MSTKLLLLTILFVMLSEVMIYVPSLANFRNTWLAERLERTTIALLVAEKAGKIDMLSEEATKDILKQLGVQTIAVRRDGLRQLIAMSDMPGMVTSEFRVNEMVPGDAILEALKTLLNGSERTTRVVAGTPEFSNGEVAEVEIVLNEGALHDAMIVHSFNILKLSLMISVITAALVFLALRALFVRPIRRVTQNMLRFAQDPEDASRVIATSERSDEIGVAQNQLSHMQSELQLMLAEKRTLADLGLAVSKISHDLRNILATAVLFSDRLQTIDDPAVQRFAPKLVRALDRAIDYCQSTLAYGRAREAEPSIRVVQLHTLVEEVAEVLGLDEHDSIQFQNKVSETIVVDADPDQLFRIILNLCRNSVQAMKDSGGGTTGSIVNSLSISASLADNSCSITVSDTGPGIADSQKGLLFKAFQSRSGMGGTGLGLAIASELVQAHEGTLQLDDSAQGASFTICLPRARIVGNAEQKLHLIQDKGESRA